MSATHHPSAVTDGEESDANFSGDKQWETSKQNFAKTRRRSEPAPGRHTATAERYTCQYGPGSFAGQETDLLMIHPDSLHQGKLW